MWLLHQRHDHGIRRTAQSEPGTRRCADQTSTPIQPVPLRYTCSHHKCGETRGTVRLREETMNIHASRRDILKGTGSLVVSFSLFGEIDATLAQGVAAKPLVLTEVDSFLAIDPKGMVTVYSGKVDLGTGVRTALTQIVADELDVPITRINLVQGDTATTPEQGTTWGSLSVQIGGMQLRNAAATAKIALIEEAAKRLSTKPEDLKVTDGVIYANGKHVSYGELIGGKSFLLKLDQTKPVKSKDPKDFKVVGKS